MKLPGTSSCFSTSSGGSSRRCAISSKIFESTRSATRRPTVSPPAPYIRPMVITGTEPPPRPLRLLQVVAELLRTRGMAQLAQRLGLDLSNPLPGHAEALADLFQRPLVPVDESKSELEDPAFTWRERVEDVFHLVVEHRQRGGVRGRDRLLVLDEVAEMGVLLLSDRSFERHRVLRDLYDLADLVGGDAHLLPHLVVRRLASELLQQATLDPHQLVDGLDHVDGDPDGARLVRDCPRDRLPDPPGGVSRELVALVIVELLYRPDQAHV